MNKFKHHKANSECCCNGLKKRGIRLTIPRQVIINILHNTIKHLSAEDIYFEVHKKNPNIGLTTVYRTLDLLLQHGIIYKFDFGQGKSRYELVKGNKKSGHHHHLICSSCGKIIDYDYFLDEEKELIDKTEKELVKKYNFNIHHHVMHFYGECKKCSKRKK